MRKPESRAFRLHVHARQHDAELLPDTFKVVDLPLCQREHEAFFVDDGVLFDDLEHDGRRKCRAGCRQVSNPKLSRAVNTSASPFFLMSTKGRQSLCAEAMSAFLFCSPPLCARPGRRITHSCSPGSRPCPCDCLCRCLLAFAWASRAASTCMGAGPVPALVLTTSATSFCSSAKVVRRLDCKTRHFCDNELPELKYLHPADSVPRLGLKSAFTVRVFQLARCRWSCKVSAS